MALMAAETLRNQKVDVGTSAEVPMNIWVQSPSTDGRENHRSRTGAAAAAVVALNVSL